MPFQLSPIDFSMPATLRSTWREMRWWLASWMCRRILVSQSGTGRNRVWSDPASLPACWYRRMCKRGSIRSFSLHDVRTVSPRAGSLFFSGVWYSSSKPACRSCDCPHHQVSMTMGNGIGELFGFCWRDLLACFPSAWQRCETPSSANRCEARRLYPTLARQHQTRKSTGQQLRAKSVAEHFCEACIAWFSTIALSWVGNPHSIWLQLGLRCARRWRWASLRIRTWGITWLRWWEAKETDIPRWWTIFLLSIT